MIAVVDDEETVRKALVRLLQAAGYDARAFSSGAALLQSLSTYDPDCLVLDLQMPGLSGTDVQRALKHAGVDIPVVVMTAHDSALARAECLREGAIAYLCKPVDERALFDALKLANSQ
jgi:FixJ family two-component response regulator